MNNIDLVLETVQASTLIGQFVKLKPLQGRTFIGLCPFHHEKTPSFRVNDDKKFFYCFGCNKGGNILNFLQDYKNISFSEALNEIASSYNIKLVKFNKAESLQTSNQKSLMEGVMEVFISQLKSERGKKALDYLRQKRGLSLATISHFKLGLCGRESDFLLSYFPDKIEELIQLGLISKSENGGFYNPFKGRIMFPICNKKGEVIAFAGRIFEKDQEISKLAKYVNSKESAIFKKNISLYAIEKVKNNKSPIILTEGYLDVIKMHQNGFTSTVAQMGTALSQENIGIMFGLCDEIIFCYDSDNAGKKAESRSINLSLPLLTPQKKISFLELETKDADEFLDKHSKNLMQKKIEDRKPLFEKIFQNLSSDVNFKNPQENALCESNLMQFCTKISDNIVKKSYQAYFKNQLFGKRLVKNKSSNKNFIDNGEIPPRDAILFALFLKFPDFFKQDYYFEHFVPFQIKKLERIIKGEEVDLKIVEKIKLYYPLKDVLEPKEVYDKIYNDFIFQNLQEDKKNALATNDFERVKKINEELMRLKNRT